MARTLDEILEQQQQYAQTPIPAVATYSTPGWGPTMGMTNMPSQAELIRQAMPTSVQPAYALSPTSAMNMGMAMGQTPMGMPMAMPPPPPPSPMAQYMAAQATQYVNPAMAQQQQGLAASAAYLDPSKAGQAFAQQALGGPSTLGQVASRVGDVMTFIPGLNTIGLGLSLGGQWLGDKLTNNPVTRWVHQQMYGRASQDLSMMAQLQHGTAGMMNLTGASAGLGGSGMGTSAALQLGQRYRRMGEDWAAKNPALAKQMGGGDADVGAQRYAQDITKLTQMAGESGLLDAATNIEQVGDTVQKLFKVLGTMGKITGDPDFRNNLREIANMRQMGLTIDQAVNATRDIQRYARGAGVTRSEIMGQGGAMGMQAFGQAGMVPGVGMVYGAQAQMQARQLAGAYTPMQEALLGGQEGIAGRWAQQQAGFAAGPMNLMMGAAMTGGPGGTISIDATKLQEMLKGGTTLAGMAGKSAASMTTIARQMAAAQGNKPGAFADAMIQLRQMQPELQSQMAQQLGPEGMRMLQMQTIASLAKPRSEGGMGLGLSTAAQMVAVGGTVRERQQNAQMITGMMTSPEFYQREKERLGRLLDTARAEARTEAQTRREERQEIRDKYSSGFLGYRAIGRGLGKAWEYTGGAIGDVAAGIGRNYDRMNAKAAEDRALQMELEEDKQRGIKAIHFTATMALDPKIMEEMSTRVKEDPAYKALHGEGVGRYERARRLREMGRRGELGEFGKILGRTSKRQMELAQQARGETGGFFGGIGAFVERTAFGRDVAIGEAISDIAETDVISEYVDQSAAARETRRTEDEVYAAADMIERTRDFGSKEFSTMLQNLDRELVTLKKHGKISSTPSKTTFNIQEAVLSYAGKVGRGEKGTVIKKKDLRKAVREGMIKSGISPAEADRAIKDNTEFWENLSTTMIRESGGPEERAALEETKDIAAQFGEDDLEAMQDKLADMQDEYEDILDEAGVTDRGIFGVDELTAKEKSAIATFKSASPEVAEAMILMGMAHEDADVPEERKKEAKRRLLEITKTDSKTIDAARGLMAKVKKTSGDTGVSLVGRISKLQQGPLSGLSESLKQMREGKGPLGIFTRQEKLASKAIEAGYEYREGKVVKPEEAAGTPEKQKEIESLEKQIANLDEMKKQFAGFGKSSSKLFIAAKAQEKAAKVLGGEKVVKFLEEWNAKNR